VAALAAADNHAGWLAAVTVADAGDQTPTGRRGWRGPSRALAAEGHADAAGAVWAAVAATGEGDFGGGQGSGGGEGKEGGEVRRDIGEVGVARLRRAGGCAARDSWGWCRGSGSGEKGGERGQLGWEWLDGDWFLCRAGSAREEGEDECDEESRQWLG
jgi:hypothetical protein